MEKITRKSVVEKMLEMARGEMTAEEIEVAEKVIASFNRKSTRSEASKEKAKAARKEAMDAQVEVLCGILNGSEGMSCKEIAAVEGTIFTGATSQKVSAVARAAINDGIVVKEMDRKVAKYRLA